MSQKIDPREVLISLNELGYTNISAQQLKDFIIDLKKIIKYELKKSVGHAFVISDSNNYSTPKYAEHKLKPQNFQSNDIFEILHNYPTQASKAKMVNKIDRQIAIHITHPKKKNIEHEHCIHLENDVKLNHVKCTSEKPLSNKESISSELMINEDILQTKIDSSKRKLESELSSQRLLPTSKQSHRQSAISSSVPSSKFKKSKTAVLRNTSSAKSLKKSDPVALYHQYQEEWKNTKFPGEDNHLDLRWAVREKLINGPPVEKPLRKCSSTRKVY